MIINNQHGGRLTVMTPERIRKLESAFIQGFTVETACHLSGVGTSTYYEHIKHDKEFSDKMKRAKLWPTEMAKQVIIGAISQGDVNTSKWWLERKAKDEFSIHYAHRDRTDLEHLNDTRNKIRAFLDDRNNRT